MNPSVKLVGITKPVIPECSEPDHLIAYCARVSNPRNQANHGTASKLLRYLIKEQHWSPLEMVNIVMEVRTTRDIARQILRHRSFSFQEFCVSEGTKVTTKTKNGGYSHVKIEDLYKRYCNKQYWDMSDKLIKVYNQDSKTFDIVEIKEVFNTGQKQCVRVTLDNGRTIECTTDHKLLTYQGFKTVNNINNDTFIACNGVALYQQKEWLESAKKLAIETKTGLKGIADLAGVKPVTISKWLRKFGLSFSKKDVASYVDPWNTGLEKTLQPRYGKTHNLETKNKMSETALTRKENHNFYKNGKFTFENLSWRKQVSVICGRYKNQLLEQQNYTCPETGRKLNDKTCDVDHILPVCFRPDLAFDYNNLRVVDKDFHRKKSLEESKQCKKTVFYSKVKSIENIGIKQTYDIEVNHSSHNYIANGIVTHNSQRYAEVEGNFQYRETRLQDTKNRQNSIETEEISIISNWNMIQDEVIDFVSERYKEALDLGIAKEQARSLLPEGLTPSVMYMNGNLRSWVHYCALRMGNGTQKEHSEIAKLCWNILLEQFPFLDDPIITEALNLYRKENNLD